MLESLVDLRVQLQKSGVSTFSNPFIQATFDRIKKDLERVEQAVTLLSNRDQVLEWIDIDRSFLQRLGLTDISSKAMPDPFDFYETKRVITSLSKLYRMGRIREAREDTKDRVCIMELFIVL